MPAVKGNGETIFVVVMVVADAEDVPSSIVELVSVTDVERLERVGVGGESDRPAPRSQQRLKYRAGCRR